MSLRGVDWTDFAFPKAGRGQTIKAVKARKHRTERVVIQNVRGQCEERDGDCRFAGVTSCAGESEWAHFEEKRRFKTRGMKPEERHTTRDSFMACTKHHALYDARKLLMLAQTEKGADGPITWDVPGYGVYQEPPLECKRPEEIKS